MIYEDCRYDARKSRESVNIKIHVSLDEFFLLSYTCSESATYKYHMINTGTSCYSFSSRIKKTIGACIHRYVSFFIFKNLLNFWESPSRREENSRDRLFLTSMFLFYVYDL